MSSQILVGVSGSGILGSAILRRLGSAASGISLSGRNGTARLDLSVMEQVKRYFSTRNISLCVNAAAYSDVDGCERNPGLAESSNAIAVKNLAQVCSDRKIPFIHISTNYVFDGKKREPYAETDLPLPINIYGLTKWMGEYYALTCTSPTAIIRTSWLFGEGNPLNFVTVFASKLKSEPLVRVLDDQKDSPTYVEDLVDAILRVRDKLIFAQKEGLNFKEIFQVCNAGVATRLEMTQAMKEILSSRAKVERIDSADLKERPARRPSYGAMSPAKYESFAGKPMRPWEDALREYLRGSFACASS